MLQKVKAYLRIKSDVLDDEINDSIDAAIQSLKISGVTLINKSDPLIVQAVKVYCKAQFETDTSKSEKYMQSFEHLKQSLSLSSDYSL